MRIYIGLFALVAAAILATGCPASTTTTAKPPPTPEPKAPATSDPLRHPKEVHLKDIIQLTAGGENAEAYWSFDNSQLIFQTKRPPYQCDQIMRMPSDRKGEPVLVSTGKGTTTCSYFLLGDQEVVYSSTHELSPDCPPKPDHSKGYVWPLHNFEVYRANVDGSNLHKLTDRDGYDAEATVCPKDGSIIFTSDRSGDLELYRMDADGKNVKQLTNTMGYDGGAFFSEDCSQIVWRASRPKGKELEDYRSLLAQNLVRPSKLEIFVADADGKNARQVTYLDSAAFAPFFHPSGKRILFSTNYKDPTQREFNIWAVNTDGTDLEQITFAPDFDGFPMFSHDGKRLAFSSNRNQGKPHETDVYVATWVEGAPQNAEVGPAERFRDRVAWLADDTREGRGIGTAGLDRAADWLASELKAQGAAPAADGKGSFKQSFEVPVKLHRGKATGLKINGADVAADAFVPSSFSASGQASAKTVFAGYGIVAKDLGVDDYKRVKAKGKIVVVRRFTPSAKPFDDIKNKRRYGDLQYKAFVARQRGAVGLIVVDVPGKGEKEVPDAPLPELRPAGSDAGIPVVVVSRAAGQKLIRQKRRHTVELNVALEQEKKPVHNIVAKIAAKAPNRLPGAVVIGAHYDHLGFGAPGSLESGKNRVIHNGADDNASGSAALIEIAGWLAKRQDTLRRDVYIVAFTAEESGLLGSSHFVRHLPDGLAAKDIVAMLNMDMIGRMENNQVQVLGGKSALEWEDIVLPSCAKERIGCKLGGDGYGPSDQTPFYAAGAPVLHFFTGSHIDYHKGSDDAFRINAIGGAKITAVVAAIAEAVSNREARLTFQRTSMPPPQGDVRLRGASLGTIPAYGDHDGEPGMLLNDVRPNGPAAKAGLRRGDRIIKIDKTDVRSIRDVMYVLREAVPGQKAKITVLRDGKKVTVEAVYAAPRRRRGGRH